MDYQQLCAETATRSRTRRSAATACASRCQLPTIDRALQRKFSSGTSRNHSTRLARPDRENPFSVVDLSPFASLFVTLIFPRFFSFTSILWRVRRCVILCATQNVAFSEVCYSKVRGNFCLRSASSVSVCDDDYCNTDAISSTTALYCTGRGVQTA